MEKEKVMSSKKKKYLSLIIACWIFLPEETVCPGWRKPPVRTTETAN